MIAVNAVLRLDDPLSPSFLLSLSVPLLFLVGICSANKYVVAFVASGKCSQIS